MNKLHLFTSIHPVTLTALLSCAAKKEAKKAARREAVNSRFEHLENGHEIKHEFRAYPVSQTPAPAQLQAGRKSKTDFLHILCVFVVNIMVKTS